MITGMPEAQGSRSRHEASLRRTEKTTGKKQEVSGLTPGKGSSIYTMTTLGTLSRRREKALDGISDQRTLLGTK